MPTLNVPNGIEALRNLTRTTDHLRYNFIPDFGTDLHFNGSFERISSVNPKASEYRNKLVQIETEFSGVYTSAFNSVPEERMAPPAKDILNRMILIQEEVESYLLGRLFIKDNLIIRYRKTDDANFITKSIVDGIRDGKDMLSKFTRHNLHYQKHIAKDFINFGRTAELTNIGMIVYLTSSELMAVETQAELEFGRFDAATEELKHEQKKLFYQRIRNYEKAVEFSIKEFLEYDNN